MISPSPGPHPVKRCIPLVLVLRDMLHYCDNAREAKSVVRSRKVWVDGRPVRDPGFPLGLMDTMSLPDLSEHYRVLLDTRGSFQLVPIKDQEAEWKLVRIENKTSVRGGHVQLNLSDGRNILSKDGQSTRDTLKIALPGQEVMESYPFQEGSVVFLIGGKHVGQVGHIAEVIVERSSRPNVVRLAEGFSTIQDYAFVVGKQKPVIALPEGV